MSLRSRAPPSSFALPSNSTRNQPRCIFSNTIASRPPTVRTLMGAPGGGGDGGGDEPSSPVELSVTVGVDSVDISASTLPPRIWASNASRTWIGGVSIVDTVGVNCCTQD